MDDEPLVLALARNALERAGYQVLAATGGMEALGDTRAERETST